MAHSLAPVLVGWVFLASSLPMADGSPGLQEPLLLAADERRLGRAAVRVTKAASSFDQLRADLKTAPAAKQAAMRRGLSEQDEKLMSGQSAVSVDLSLRFQDLQRQGLELFAAARSNSSCSRDLQPSRRTLDDTNSTEPSHASEVIESTSTADTTNSSSPVSQDLFDNASISSAAKKNGKGKSGKGSNTSDAPELCVSPATVGGYLISEISLELNSFEVKAACDRGYDGTAELTACEEHGKPYSLTGCRKQEPCSAPWDSTGYIVTEHDLERATFNVTASCASEYEGNAIVVCDVKRGIYNLSGCVAVANDCNDSWRQAGAVARYVEELESLAKDLEQHLELLRSIRSKMLAPSASVLAARRQLEELQEAARQVSDPQPLEVARRLGARLVRIEEGHDEEAELASISRESDEAIGLAKQLASTASTASQGTGRAEPSRGSSGCTTAGVVAAGQRFDAAARGFTGRVLQEMLPNEENNLHRIVHSLEVLRHSLIQELAKGDGAAADVDMENDCMRYFSGVSRLEADLAHYRNLVEPRPAATSQKAPARRPASQPLREGQLQSLELSGASPVTGGRIPAAGVAAAKGRPALDASSFR